MSDKKTITTIVKKADKCVIYHDDGIYCQWTETKAFDFELIAETKANADGIVLLVSEEEMAAFKGKKIAFDDHEKWVIPRWLIWEVYGEMMPSDDEELKIMEFMRGLII